MNEHEDHQREVTTMSVNHTHRSGVPDYPFRYPDWDKAHVLAWQAQGRHLRNREIRQWLAAGIQRIRASIEALVISPVTQNRLTGSDAAFAALHRSDLPADTTGQDREQAFWSAYRPARTTAIRQKRLQPKASDTKAA